MMDLRSPPSGGCCSGETGVTIIHGRPHTLRTRHVIPVTSWCATTVSLMSPLNAVFTNQTSAPCAADPISVPVAKPSVADKRVFTLTIGRRRTNARYYVNSVQDVYGLFQTLAVSDARRRRVSSLTKVINRSSSIPMVSPPIPKPLSSSGLSVGTHSSSVNSSGSLAPPAVSSPADYSVPFRWADTEDVSTAGIGFAQMTSSHLLQQPMFTFPAPPPVPPKDADTGPP